MGAAILVFIPPDVAGRQVDPDLERALGITAARVQATRSDLEFALARLDDATISGLVSGTLDPAVVERQLAARIGDADGLPAGSVDVAVRPAATGRKDDDPIASYLRVTRGERQLEVRAQIEGAAKEILDDVARGTDVDLALVGGRGADVRLVTSADTGWQAAWDDDGVAFAGDAPARSRTAMLDRSQDLGLVAAVDGSPAALVLRGRGGEVQVALLLLLAAGMLCAVTVALIMNRMLGAVADSAERMSAGDFEIRLPVVGSDAGARVAASLNNLAAELQMRIGTLVRTIERLDRTLGAIDDGVCTWNEKGDVETWNVGAAHLTGVDERAARGGTPTTEMLATELRPGRRRVLLPLADGTAHLAVELAVRRMRDGGTLQVFRDAAPALSIEHARKNFLVTAAHELRTPLTSILGFAVTLADEQLELPDDVRRRAIRQILEDAERLDTVVSSLFENSLLARDKVEVTPERVAVEAAVMSAIASVDVGDAQIDIAVDHDIEPDTAVRADRAALERVLSALVDNAVKYGQPPFAVRIGHAGERIRIVVTDHGAGIPSELQVAVFEPFFRADPEMRTDVGGAGMGLYSARRLVEAMGGSVSVAAADRATDSNGGAVGTDFTIELPMWLHEVVTPDLPVHVVDVGSSRIP